jgi:hypothetical protein
MRKTVASVGIGSCDGARDGKKGLAMTMRKTKQKPEQQLGMSGSWCRVWKQVRNFRVIRAPDSCWLWG